MTDREIYQTIRAYWNDLYADKNQSIQQWNRRMTEGNKIYDALMYYNYLSMHQVKVKL